MGSAQKWVQYADNTPGFEKVTVTDYLHYYPEMKRIADAIKSKFGITKITASFFRKDDNSLLTHKDPPDLLCSVNIILEGGPIVFEKYGPIDYTCALVNIQEFHSLPTGKRKMAKFCIREKSYDTLTKISDGVF